MAGKGVAQPLFQFIGGLRTTAEVTVVAGYYVDQRSIADVVDEVGRLADSGYRRVKIMLKGDDPEFDRKYVSAVAGKLPGRVAADAHWSWNTLTEAKRICRQFDALGLNFLEDPFAASDIRVTHELRRDLVTTVGGITGAIEAINIAAAAGRTVFPHVFCPIHVHLACAFPNVEGVELIPEESGADPLPRLLRNVPVAREGEMSPGSEPGIGISVDWEAVEKLSRRHVVIA